MLYIFICLLLFIPASDNSTLSADSRLLVFNGDFAPVAQKLLENGADTSFVDYLINHPSSKLNERFIKVNVTGYLANSDYSSQYNDYSVKKCLEFINFNSDILDDCSSSYDIPKEVITAIMWIETKHGTVTGNSHVPSVYLSAALASEQKYIEMNIKELHRNHKGNKSDLPELEEKIRARSIRKANWAIKELIALEKIRKTTKINIMNLYGSWAGAFGWSQFLPSSYVNWAVDGDMDGTIDLFNVHDASCSIANYLRVNGWGNSEEARRKAIFHYNNSNAYVDAVLTLASKLNGFQNLEDIYDFRLPLEMQLEK